MVHTVGTFPKFRLSGLWWELISNISHSPYITPPAALLMRASKRKLTWSGAEIFTGPTGTRPTCPAQHNIWHTPRTDLGDFTAIQSLHCKYRRELWDSHFALKMETKISAKRSQYSQFLQGAPTSKIGLNFLYWLCVPPAFTLISFVLFFDPEDGGDIFLRNVCWLSTDYVVLYLRIRKPWYLYI
jgi:hypothetical protein